LILALPFLDQLGNKNIGIVYDIGNAVYCEHDIALDMNVLDENIVHIHLKDKNEQGDNVVLGDGKVNFSQFFDILKMNKYTGDFTLETSRGKNAISTATANIEFIRRSFHT
jgi:sugar phosphate isomerase/epimerase